MVFLFYSLSSVLVIMFSLVSASSNIQGELPTSKRRRPLDFSEERKFFICIFEQERRFKLLRKGKFTFFAKTIQMTHRNRKDSSLFENTIERKKEDNIRVEGLLCIFVQKDDKEIRRGQYMRAERTFCSCCH